MSQGYFQKSGEEISKAAKVKLTPQRGENTEHGCTVFVYCSEPTMLRLKSLYRQAAIITEHAPGIWKFGLDVKGFRYEEGVQ